MRVFKNAWFGRFARKERLSAIEFWNAVVRAERGLIDADLGGGVIKQRIARTGAGKANSYRAIVLYQKGKSAFFVYGFSKSALSNIRDDELEHFKQTAKLMFALSDHQLSLLIERGQLDEVGENGQKIPE